ncbi:MAG: hypothetical protein L0Y54_18680 [Sporichthyaceae bacterium]|nr:hypothetical protein [Sporichthyaceae bacterium]
MPQPSFSELLADCERSALKLELRDVYLPNDPGYQAWRAGQTEQAVKRYADWTDTVRAAVARGISMRRVRVVSEPVSDYIRFEHAVTQDVNISAGEAIRWLPRRQASTVCLPPSDFWLFDGRLVQWVHFTGEGESAGSEVTDDQGVAGLCQTAWEAAWERGIDHAAFRI